MRFLKLLFLLLVMMIGAAFAVMNADVVTLNYYFGSSALPLSVVLVGAVAVGSLIGVVAIMFRVIGLKRENAELRQKAHLASQEVKNLRAIPLQDH
ncbi:MAG: DUF1049 domain-containing protein [Gammaproteobacteria bacterium]|nr:DUF1049 domain-containing protein [Gammaproteobacteria bacterium]